MNLKTTLVLLLLAGAGVALYWFGPTYLPQLGLAPAAPATASAGTLEALQEITPDSLTQIEVKQGDRVLHLERGAGGEWSLPGKWPTRKPEVEQLVTLLGGLRSRFTPLSAGGLNLAEYGLNPPAVTVEVRAGRRTYGLAFGEGSDNENRFSRPTYLRLEDKPEIVRLAPGIVAALDKPLDYYQQRRIFPSERIAQEGSQEKNDRLAAAAVAVKGAEGAYTLVRAGEEWELREPVRDRADPDKLRTLLAAVPDLWAEQFVRGPKKDLDEYGLKNPEKTLMVTRPGGDVVTLLIGKQSRMATRKVTKPVPPQFGGMGEPRVEIVHDEYRYAKLADNEQIFEIKADRLKDVFVAANTLRDATLARFRTNDVRRVELTQGGQPIVLAKDGDRWKLEKPVQTDADAGKVNELLDKLALLQARDKDVLDKPDLKSLGLDPATATVKLSVEEEKGEGDAKTKKTRTITLDLGKHDAAANKLYVRADGRDRANAVDPDVLKLAQRPALTYRGRRVMDFSPSDLAKIDVQRGGEMYTLEQVKGVWKLAAPVQADIDAGKASQLADDLGHLDAVEYVTESAKPEELETAYGVGKPAASAKVTFTDAKKPAQTLHVGKQRPGKDEYFAKLDSAPGVFVIRKDVRDALDRDSLAYRTPEIWKIAGEEVAELRINKGGQNFTLKRDGQAWKIAGPFDAPATTPLVQPMIDELANLKSERYAAHEAKDPAAFGLDKPAVTVTVVPAKKDGAKEQTLQIGKPADGMGRFARRGDTPAVFVVADKTAAALDRGPLDLLDRNLLAVDPKTVERIRGTGPGGNWTLQKQGNEWRMTEGPSPFAADNETVTAVVNVWSKLTAAHFAAYGKPDPTAFGLDKPTASVTITIPAGGKPVEHTLQLGKPAEGSSGDHYARLDNGPGVFVLSAPVAKELTKTPLEFVPRTVLQLPVANVIAILRAMDEEDVEIKKQGDGWQLTEPVGAKADDQSVNQLVRQLTSLRAARIAAYPAGDLKPFGLDKPEALVTLRLTNQQPAERKLKIGKVAEEKTGERFATLEGGNAVVVLPGLLSRTLTAPALSFRDHTVARFAGADRITLERVPRKAVFAKTDGVWKLTEPVAAEAEQTELEDFLQTLATLRADELVEEKPDDWRPYGLDKPETRWRVQAGGKDVLDLVVGAAEKNGPRRYARLANGDLVFLLDAAASMKVLAEYRNRILGPPLDVAQAEKITYKYQQNPFSLEKVNSEWRLAGKPDLKVNQAAVSDMLDALAGMKAERYAEDKAAERKPYGLDPPQLVLEVETRAGKRTLEVGRPEGGSKRLYAHVVDGGRADVIVLGAADVARIVRPLDGFTKAK